MLPVFTFDDHLLWGVSKICGLLSSKAVNFSLRIYQDSCKLKFLIFDILFQVYIKILKNFTIYLLK